MGIGMATLGLIVIFVAMTVLATVRNRHTIRMESIVAFFRRAVRI
jgi:hypothetical protein